MSERQSMPHYLRERKEIKINYGMHGVRSAVVKTLRKMNCKLEHLLIRQLLFMEKVDR